MNSLLDLTGKAALVTGASSGIGRAAALSLAEQGARVAISYHRNEEGGTETSRRLRELGADAPAFQADFTDGREIRTLMESVVEALGPVDILVNNAGSLIARARILDLTEELWDEAMALNLKSAFLCSRAVVPHMLERGSGAIVNVASLAGRNGGALGSIHYAASKAGLIAFTKGLAKELAPHGIRVNAVNPGIIDTPFQERFSTDEAIRSFVAATPLGRVGHPDEIGRVVAFLASDAASFVVGETFEVNGGIAMF